VSAPLSGIATLEDAAPLAECALALIAEIYPLRRSITGEGVRETLRRLSRRVSLDVTEVPTGTPVFDWEVPPEWTLREAYIADAAGRRLIDVRDHALHVVGYSTPVRKRMPLSELRKHLHTLPDRPDWIPYRTSYYRAAWGFCLTHRELMQWPEGEYEVVIDSELAPGSLTYAECQVRGETDREVLVYTHTCHPALANDNACGIAVAAVLAEEASKSSPNLSYRFIFGPGTIGSITWLARNETRLDRVRAGLVIGLLGDRGALTYKRSRRGSSEMDLIAGRAVREIDPKARVLEFTPYGYDERQFCSPGIDLSVGRLTRSPHDAYPEYHTSADNLSILDVDAISESILAVATILNRVDGNRRYRNLSPKGEPRLGKRGLFRSTGGTNPNDFEHAMLWLLSMANGEHGLNDAQVASGLPLATLERAAQALVEAGLLEELPA
jgi:aminopeptidase-like protein